MTKYDEDAKTLFTRRAVPALKTGIASLDAHAGLFPGQWMEIAGYNGAGKTHALMHIALICVLPSTLGGLGSEAVFVDGDGKFDDDHFFEMLDQKLVHAGDTVDVEAVRQECLGRLHYIVCNSSVELLAVLKALPGILQKEQSPDHPVRCLLIDNLLATCWTDKANEEDPDDVTDAPLSFNRIQTSIFSAIDGLLNSERIFVVTSKYSKIEVTITSGTPQWNQRERIQHKLQKYFTQRLMLMTADELPPNLRQHWNVSRHVRLAKWMDSDSPPFHL